MIKNLEEMHDFDVLNLEEVQNEVILYGYERRRSS